MSSYRGTSYVLSGGPAAIRFSACARATGSSWLRNTSSLDGCSRNMSLPTVICVFSFTVIRPSCGSTTSILVRASVLTMHRELQCVTLPLPSCFALSAVPYMSTRNMPPSTTYFLAAGSYDRRLLPLT